MGGEGWGSESCLDGKRRRLMRRGTRATREEGERDEGRGDDGSSFGFVIRCHPFPSHRIPSFRMVGQGHST